MSDSLGQHCLAAARGAIKEDSGGGGEQRGSVRVEVRHGERIDDRLLDLFDDVFESANICEEEDVSGCGAKARLFAIIYR